MIDPVVQQLRHNIFTVKNVGANPTWVHINNNNKFFIIIYRYIYIIIK